MIKYGIIGAGWRAEFYLRIANLVPEKFSVSGIYIRNPEKREEFSKKYNVPIFDNLDDLLNTNFDFIVSCVFIFRFRNMYYRISEMFYRFNMVVM